MRILKFERGLGGYSGSAEIRLTEGEIRALGNILYKEDKPSDIVSGLNKDFYVLRELLYHGQFDRDAIEILCRTAKIELKEKK